MSLQLKLSYLSYMHGNTPLSSTPGVAGDERMRAPLGRRRCELAGVEGAP